MIDRASLRRFNNRANSTGEASSLFRARPFAHEDHPPNARCTRRLPGECRESCDDIRRSWGAVSGKSPCNAGSGLVNQPGEGGFNSFGQDRREKVTAEYTPTSGTLRNLASPMQGVAPVRVGRMGRKPTSQSCAKANAHSESRSVDKKVQRGVSEPVNVTKVTGFRALLRATRLAAIPARTRA